MVPPIWLDDRNRRRPTRGCWTCGREEPLSRLRLEDLCRLAWEPWRTQTIVNWCGHSQEYVPWPEARGWWRLVPVWDADSAGPAGRVTID